MTTAVQPVGLVQASRIQIELLRRLGRVRLIIGAFAFAALAIEVVQARLAAAGAPLESLAGPRFLAVALLALAWGGALWRGESPKHRQYLLSQPVDVSAHEFSRIVAGATWLAVALAGSIVIGVAGTLIRRVGAPEGALPWVGLFTGGLLIYLAVSAVATVTSRVAEVLIFSYLALVVLIPLLSLVGVGKGAAKLFNAAVVGTYGLRAALIAPHAADASGLTKWVIAMLIWYAVAGGMVGAALWWRRSRSGAR